MGPMRVDSVMELYLTAYGWEIYSLLFFTFVVFGGILYPFGRIIFDETMERFDSRTEVTLASKTLVKRLLIAMLIFFIAVVPFVKYDAQQATIQQRCVNLTPAEALSNDKVIDDSLSKRFGESTRVPLIPYLAMTLAAGVNSVMYKNMPCGNDVLAMNDMMNSLNIDKAPNAEALKEEYTKFNQQCKKQADDLMLDHLKGGSSTPGRSALMQALLHEYIKKRDPMAETVYTEAGELEFNAATTENTKNHITNYAGTEFYREVFYSKERCQKAAPAQVPAKPVSAADFSAAWTDFCKLVIPLQSQTPIEGFNYNAGRDTEANEYQQGAGSVGQPTCDEWWGTAGTGLRDRLSQASYNSAIDHKKNCILGIFSCSTVEPISELPIDPGNMDSFDREAAFGTLDDAKRDELLRQAISNSPPASGTGVGGGENFGILIGSIVGAGLEFASFGNFQGPIAKLTDFYATAKIGKIMLRFLQPMILMAIYALWLIYMVVSEFSPMAMIKGMMTIFALKFVSALWAWADYMDSVVFSMIMPGVGGLSVLAQSPARVLIDIASTMFYFIIPMVLFMVISHAGGNSPKAGYEGMDSKANQAGRMGGGMAGGMAAKGAGKVGQMGKSAVNKLRSK